MGEIAGTQRTSEVENREVQKVPFETAAFFFLSVVWLCTFKFNNHYIFSTITHFVHALNIGIIYTGGFAPYTPRNKNIPFNTYIKHLNFDICIMV